MSSAWDIKGLTEFFVERIKAGDTPGVVSTLIYQKFRVEMERARVAPPTRNACVGKVHRLGLTGSEKRPRNRTKVRSPLKPPAPPPAERRAAPAQSRGAPKFAAEPFVPIRDFVAPPERRIYQFRDLDKPRAALGEKEGVRHCRYIEGEPRDLFKPGNQGSFYCGCLSELGIEYCKQHDAMMFRAVPKRERRVEAAKHLELKQEKELVS